MKILVLSFLIVIGLSSCNALLKTYLGIKDADIYVSNQDRKEYYEGMISNVDYGYSIRTFSDSTKLLNTFKEGLSMPMLVLEYKENNQFYYLNCYEDIEYQADLVNEKNFSKLEIANNDIRKKLNKILNSETRIVVDNRNNIQDKDIELYYLSGLFMGRRLQKRVDKIKKIKNIKNLNIIDLSVNE
ncbi:hypothetical protein [Psychroflexus sp. MBR-150]